MNTTFDKASDHFTSLKFVAKAVNKAKGQDSRVNLNHIYCTGTKIMATDGHRLHIYEPEESPLQQGYYEILKNTRSELRLIPIDLDMEYPDIERVTPSNDGLKGFEDKSSLFGKYAQIIRSFDEGSLNCDYLKDALTDTDISMYHIKDHMSPLLLKGGFLTAVIMPTRS